MSNINVEIANPLLFNFILSPIINYTIFFLLLKDYLFL